MLKLEIIIVLMAILVWLNSIAERFELPFPIVLVIAGLIISIVPGLPLVQLNPNVVFLIFLPPLLYDAASKTSWHDFKKWRRPILFLAIGLVLFTTISVAAVAHWLIPGFTWQLGFLLGAIVSPPDAVAATSVIRKLRLPKHVITILEGESLINDASALIAYRYAIIAITGGASFNVSDASIQFMIVAFSGIAIGLLVGFCIGKIHKGIENPTIETTISLIAPFMAYLIAENFAVSGVLAVVASGMYLAWHSSELLSFQTRLKVKGFWDIIVFLLNGFVFIIIGLQLPAIWKNDNFIPIPHLIGYGLLISLVTIIIRIGWIFPLASIAILHRKQKFKQTRVNSQKLYELFIISWSGMRGVVSLASALAIPLTLNNGQLFPGRNVILFITFTVILVTLVLQGLTLPFFIRKFNVQESVEHARSNEKLLRLTLLNNVIEHINQALTKNLPENVIKELILNFEHRLKFVQNSITTSSEAKKENAERLQYFEAEMELIMLQRSLLIQMHKNNAYSNEIIRHIEKDLDTHSLATQSRINNIKKLTKHN